MIFDPNASLGKCTAAIFTGVVDCVIELYIIGFSIMEQVNSGMAKEFWSQSIRQSEKSVKGLVHKSTIYSHEEINFLIYALDSALRIFRKLRNKGIKRKLDYMNN